MAIEKMEMLSLSFSKPHLNSVLDKVKEETSFYPQPARKIVNNVKGVVTIEADSDIKVMLDQVEELAAKISLPLVQGKVTMLNRDYIEKALKDIAEEITAVAHNKEELVKEMEEDEDAYALLNGMSQTSLNLEELMSTTYLTTRIGRIRKRNEDKLDYYKSEMAMFLKLGESKKHIYCLYITPNEHHLMVDNVFSSMGFKDVAIPEFVHGTIEDAKRELQQQIAGMKKYIQVADDKLRTIKELRQEELLKIYSYLAYTQGLEDEKSFVVDYSSRYAIYGFIPSRLAGEMVNHFNGEEVEFKSYPCDIYEDRGIIAPTLTYNPVWAKPFESIAKVKQQDHVDMTLAFAVLYILTFFLLLGDLGLGALLVVLGLLLHKKNSGKLLTVLGVATLVGGLAYGNAFYVVDLYHSLIPQGNFIHRFINAALLLVLGTYCINTVKVIYNEKSMVNKVFSMKGIVGIIMALMVAAYLAISIETHIVVNYLPLLVVLVIGVLLIFFKNAIHKKNQN